MGVKAMGFFLAAMALAGCTTADSPTVVEDHSFRGDVAFLRKHTEVVLLTINWAATSRASVASSPRST